MHVQDQNGKLWDCSYNGTLADLKRDVCSKTGIPENVQKLYCQQRIITESTLPNNCFVTLSLGLHGGMSNCEICYENASHICKECDQKAFCSDCCMKFHSHPARVSHEPLLLSNYDVSSSGACNQSSSFHAENTKHMEISYQTDNNHDMWDSDYLPSPSTDAAFEEASMIMTLAERFNMTRFKPYQRQVIDPNKIV